MNIHYLSSVLKPTTGRTTHRRSLLRVTELVLLNQVRPLPHSLRGKTGTHLLTSSQERDPSSKTTSVSVKRLSDDSHLYDCRGTRSGHCCVLSTTPRTLSGGRPDDSRPRGSRPYKEGRRRTTGNAVYLSPTRSPSLRFSQHA